jgi:hypothetical protein
MVSLFLVAEAAKSQRWAFGVGEGIPDPHSGVFMSQIISFCFILLWLVRTLLLTRMPQEPMQFLSHVLLRPGQFTPGFLLATFPPLVVGLVKLTTVLAGSRWKLGEDAEARSRLWITLAFVVFHLLTASAVVIILTKLFV